MQAKGAYFEDPGMANLNRMAAAVAKIKSMPIVLQPLALSYMFNSQVMMGRLKSLYCYSLYSVVRNSLHHLPGTLLLF